MLLFLNFPFTCNPSRAVTVSYIGVPYYIGVPPNELPAHSEGKHGGGNPFEKGIFANEAYYRNA